MLSQDTVRRDENEEGYLQAVTSGLYARWYDNTKLTTDLPKF